MDYAFAQFTLVFNYTISGLRVAFTSRVLRSKKQNANTIRNRWKEIMPFMKCDRHTQKQKTKKVNKIVLRIAYLIV